MYADDNQIHKTLKAIKENDGFPGPLKPMVRANIIGKWATVEVSPLTGLDVQWTLTADGKKKLREYNSLERWRKKNKEWTRRGYGRPNHHTPDVVVPLTIEVLDALKAIRERGDPETTRLDILARIQRHGAHAAKTVKGVHGQDIVVYGSLAECKDGVWTLTKAGLDVEAGHIRKSECAQFSGKVR
jgi:hypothetical protein